MFLFELPVPRAVLYSYSKMSSHNFAHEHPAFLVEKSVREKCSQTLTNLRTTSQTGIIQVSPHEAEVFYKSIHGLARKEKIRAFYDYAPKLKVLMKKLGNPLALTEEEAFKSLQDESRKLANQTLRRAAAIIRQFYSEYPNNWMPHIKMNWHPRHKNHRAGYSKDSGIFGKHGGISIAMSSICDRKGEITDPVFRELPSIYKLEDVGTFVSDKWQHHLVARICHEVARVAQHYYFIEIREEPRFDSKVKTPEGFIDIYGLLRRKLVNEDIASYYLRNKKRLDGMKYNKKTVKSESPGAPKSQAKKRPTKPNSRKTFRKKSRKK